jgi:formylglycine-generating enzyme required for sulfatase activity
MEAQRQAEEARRAKEEAVHSLQEYQAASTQIVNLRARQINDYILKLDYESAHLKIIEASSFKSASIPFKKAVAEVAFWWNETKQQDRAAELLSKALQVKVSKDYKSIQTFLTDYEPVWLDSLHVKYYGDMVDIPGGLFIFHKTVKAAVSDFSIARTETTFWQYGLYCAANGLSILDYEEHAWGVRGNDPIIRVSWYDAIRYSNWLSSKLGRVPAYEVDFGGKIKLKEFANGFRLPTETEWEYAAKGGGNGSNFQYAGSNTLIDVDVNAKLSSRTRSVAQKKPNSFGLYDLSGNVWEWCYDWYGSYPKRPGTDYKGVKENKRKIVRGGAWNYNVKLIDRSAFRIKSYPDVKRNDIGFRMACSRT